MAQGHQRIRLDELIGDPALREAVRDVDRTLLAWTRGLSLKERLNACSKATSGLERLKRGASRSG